MRFARGLTAHGNDEGIGQVPVFSNETSANQIGQYRIFVETAERNIDRRYQMNRFYFSIFGGLAVAYGFLWEINLSESEVGQVLILRDMIVPFLSASVCLIWYQYLAFFRSLSRAKYKVISAMEKEMSFSPHVDEWRLLKSEGGIHRKATIIETGLVLVLFFVSAGLFVSGVLSSNVLPHLVGVWSA